MISIRKFGAALALASIPFAAVSAVENGDVHGDWTVLCSPSQQDAEVNVCQIIQDVRVQQENVDDTQIILRVRIGYDQEQQVIAAIFQMPLGLLLPQGMLLQVDESDAIRIPIQTCTAQGCRAVVALDATQEASFRSGAQLKVGLVSNRRQPIAMGVSLTGFGAGLDALMAD